jgi:hypothetical protein
MKKIIYLLGLSVTVLLLFSCKNLVDSDADFEEPVTPQPMRF